MRKWTSSITILFYLLASSLLANYTILAETPISFEISADNILHPIKRVDWCEDHLISVQNNDGRVFIFQWDGRFLRCTSRFSAGQDADNYAAKLKEYGFTIEPSRFRVSIKAYGTKFSFWGGVKSFLELEFSDKSCEYPCTNIPLTIERAKRGRVIRPFRQPFHFSLNKDGQHLLMTSHDNLYLIKLSRTGESGGHQGINLEHFDK